MSAVYFSLRPERWALLAVLASGAMLAGAHAFEIFGKMPPCALCLRQREIYWAAMATGVTGWALMRMRPTPRFDMALSVILALIFVTSAVVAAYHAGVEWRWWAGPAACSAGAVDLSEIDLVASLNEATATVSCQDAPWRMLGLSMAGWNVLVSIGLAGLSFVVAYLANKGTLSR